MSQNSLSSSRKGHSKYFAMSESPEVKAWRKYANDINLNLAKKYPKVWAKK